MSSRLERVSRVAATMRNDDKSRTGKLRRLNGESTLDTVRARSEAAQKKANEEEAIRRMKYASQVAAQPQITPAERYAQERISPNRKLNAMERRLDPGTSVQTANSAKREFERDTDNLIKAKNVSQDNTNLASKSLYAAFSSPKSEANYKNLAEEYRKKYNIKSDEEFNNALKYREYENARNKATQEEAVKKAAYNKYDNLPDEGKELVKQAYGNTEYDKSSSAQIEDRISGNIVSKLDARDAAKEKLKKQYNLTDDDLKDIKKGYKDSKKYGTPITQDEDLTARYDSLDMNAKDLLDKAYISVVGGQTANGMQRKYADDAISELQSNYGLSQNEISQLAIYRKRHKDETVGNKEFAEEQGKRAAQDATSIASIASIGTNVIGAVASPIAKLQDYAENKALERAGYSGDLTINTENPYYMPTRFTKAIRQQRGEDLDTYWNNKLGTDNHVASFVYQTVMSGADSLVAARIGSLFPSVNFGGTINGVKNTISLGAAAEGAAYSMGAGGLMLGMGAGTDTMLELADKGASAQTAVMGGLVSGAFEMLFEDLSISELSTFKGIEAMNMAKGWSKQAIKQNVKIAAEKLLGSTVTNASEEGLTELANLIYDTLANGDMSQYAEYYNDAVASGMSPDEARREALKDMTLQVLEAAAGGALMGAGFGVGGAVKLNAQRNTTYAMSPDGLVPVTPKAKGRAITAAGRVGETLQAADVVGGTAQEYKNQLLDKAGSKAKLTEKEIGKIALETQFATEGDEEKRKALQSFREEADLKRTDYKQGITEGANRTRFAITNSPITVDGKRTTINGNNKIDTEGNVFTDGKNGLEFKTGDGRTVELTSQTASQIENSDARSLALFAVNHNLKAKSANLLFNTYDGEYLTGDHASAFLNIYRQGALGTKNKALIKYYSESLSKFTADQANEIMNAGLEEKEFTPGATDFRITEKKNNFVNLQVKIMDSIAKALNKELIVTDDLFDEYTREDGTKGYRALNGTYIKGDNRIILSAKADNGLLLSFLAHEMGHEMKNTDSDAFGRLENVVKSYYTPEEFEEMKAEFVLKGYKESEAEEEIIANALFKVWDKDTIKKVIGKNKSLAVKLYNLVDKISKTYEKAIQRFTTGTDRYGNARNADVKKLIDNKQYMDDVKKVFTEYIGNMQSGKYDTTAEGGLNAIANPAEKEVVKEFGDDLGEVITDGEGDLVLATDKNEETAMYSYSTWQDRGRDELIGLLKAKGHTATEIKDVISQIEDAADYLKILAAGDAKNNKYDALAEHLIADVVTDVANGKQIVSALVPNGDYPVNIDLALICKKRVAYMKLLNYLVGEGVLEDVKFGGEAIADVNKVLRDSGFETACLGCFVESRRLQIQTWGETIAQEWNAAVDKVRKNAPYFNFSDKEGAANLTDVEINALENWLNQQEQNDKGNMKVPGRTVADKMVNLLQSLKDSGDADALDGLAKKITVGDLITPQGLTKLRSVSGELFSFVKSRYGAASPKIVQDFNPYNSEIAMMTFEAVKQITGKGISGSKAYLSAAEAELADSKPPKKDKAGLEKWNADVQNLALQKYFKDIGGIRIQSFSDFMIENVFDYLQIVADLSARDFTMHGYTKEAVALRLFGMTGIKWNGSLIAHVDPKMGKEFAGLMPASEAKAHRGILVKVDGKEYAIGFDDYERHSKFDKNSFIQSIGYKDMVALQCDKRYSPYVGSICIGVSDNQIEAMLDCDLIRMIIPYHASGMLPEFANLIGVDMYTDYTNYQNTGLGVNLFDVNGNPVTELVIGKNEKGENKYAGNKQVVDHFEWNAKVQELGDAKAAAKAYLEWCQEQHSVFNEKGDLIGYATYEPKFSKFSKHENYYKLLEDFNSYDSITGASAVQDAVKMNLPSKDNKLTAKELAEYKQALKKTGLFSDSEIEKYAKKAQMSFQDIIKESVDERIAYNKMTEPIKQETFEKVKNLLLEKYNREGNRAASIEDYLNAQKNPKTKSTLQPVEGAYGNKNSISDREYFDAIERYGEDSKEVAELVEQAAKEAGYAIKAYHGTNAKFTKFAKELFGKNYGAWSELGGGFYFAPTEKGANRWAEAAVSKKGGNATIMSVFLSAKNMIGYNESLRNNQIAKDIVFGDKGLDQPEEYGDTDKNYWRNWILDSTTRFIEYLQNRNYTPQQISELFMSMGYDGIKDAIGDNGQYVVFNPEQIKSANPVTYDDQGNIIPLSERFNSENEDIRYSYSDREDSDGNKLTTEQESFFEKSKIRDENGNLLVVYHGTDEDFTVFDKTKGRSTMDIQGMFFSPWEIDAGGYGQNVGKYYLNITNPAPESAAYKALNMYKGQNNAGVKAREYLEKLGYDGVNNGNEEYIAFNSNQIKRVDNLNPTENEDVRYSYAGNRAETADRDLLSEAEQMEKDGADSETIRQKTGWFRGYDNKWRFEIDDSKATWNDEARLKRDVYDTGYDYVKLSELMDHPELYAAYPELKNVKVYIRPNQLTTGMVYGGSTDSVFMKEYRPNSEIWRDFFTHELQHIVQNIEDFAPGSSQEMFRQLDWGEKEYAAVDKRNELADRLYAILRRHGTKISNEEIEDNRYAWTDSFVSSIINREYFKLSRLADSNKKTRELLDEYYRQAWILNSTTPYGQYMNTAGELEANDTMGRRRLSADERKRLRPNIDNENAIVLGNNAARYSLSERGDIDEYEAEQLLNTAKGEDAKAIVDAVDRELLGDAMGYGRMLGEQKRKTEQKVKDQRRKDVEYYNRRMKEIRADRDQKLMALKMLQRQKEIERREFSKRQDYKGRIIRKYEKLQKMLLHPTENQHVPADLVHSIADFLEYITPNFLQEQYRKDGTTIKKREKNNNRLMDLVYAYGKIKEEYEDVYDEEVYNLLQEASKSFGNKSIDEMDSYELSDINNLLGAIEHTIRRANKAIVEGKERDAFALARNLVRQSDEGKKKQSNFFKRLLWSQLSPYSIFHAMSNYEDGGWMDMYKILNEGQLRKTQIQVDVVEAFKDLMNNKELDKLSDYKNGLVDVGLIGDNNQPVKITRDFMLALYLHLQNEQNRNHIAEGGLTIPDFEKYYKGDMEAWGNEIVRTLAINGDLFRLHMEQNRLRELKRASNSKEIKARYDDEIAELENQMNELRADANRFMDDIMVRIESQLTDYERKFIDKARWFFNEYSKDKLNEATMQMYGFKKAREDNYMPIITDSDFLNAQFESVVRDASLENMGFMKERVKGANNAIKLFGLTDVINAQLNKVSKYAGLAPAIKEFNNVYNKKFFTDGRKTSVQEASKRRFGVYGQNYIEYLLADLQGGRKAKGSTKVFSQLRGNSYQAALLLNLRVSMAQAASYPTAAAEVGWEPLRKALLKGGKDGKIISKADRKLIDVYTPLLANRFTGGSSTDITNVKNTNLHTLSGINNRILQRTRAATDWIQMVDTATVGRLWSAAEYYVDEHYNLEKGSKEEIENGQSEYYKKVAEVFNRIVERTQPSYTTMQRPELLRNPNEMLKMFTMFMTQRAQNFNLVYDSVGKFLHENEKRKSGVYDVTDYAEAKSAMGRAVASQAIAGVTLAVMKAAADAIQHNMKGYKDDDDDITLWSVLERIFKTFLESEVSNMVGGSELFSFVESTITKSTYYGVTANVAGSIEDMTTAIGNLFKNGVNAKSLTRVATSSGMIIGIPASQMKKWIEMFVGWGQDIADGGEIYSNAGSSSAKNASTKMVKQFLNGDMESYRKTREGLKGENASTVKSHIITYLRENYVDGKLTDSEVRRVLEYVYGMSSTNINKKLDEFRKRKNGTYEPKETKKWGEE